MSLLLFGKAKRDCPLFSKGVRHAGLQLVLRTSFPHHKPIHLQVPGTSKKPGTALFSPPFGPAKKRPFLHAFCFVIRNNSVNYIQRCFFLPWSIPRNGSLTIAWGWKKPYPFTEWLLQSEICLRCFFDVNMETQRGWVFTDAFSCAQVPINLLLAAAIVVLLVFSTLSTSYPAHCLLCLTAWLFPDLSYSFFSTIVWKPTKITFFPLIETLKFP